MINLKKIIIKNNKILIMIILIRYLQKIQNNLKLKIKNNFKMVNFLEFKKINFFQIYFLKVR